MQFNTIGLEAPSLTSLILGDQSLKRITINSSFTGRAKLELERMGNEKKRTCAADQPFP